MLIPWTRHFVRSLFQGLTPSRFFVHHARSVACRVVREVLQCDRHSTEPEQGVPFRVKCARSGDANLP